jgi:hypothetical protein
MNGTERQIKLDEIRRKARAVNPAVSGTEAVKDRLSAAQQAVAANIPVIVDHVERKSRGFR